MPVINADDYAVSGVVDVADALAALPSTGGVIKFTDGDYRFNGAIDMNNVRLEGIGKPRLTSSGASLTGGTIIKGTVRLRGNGCGAVNLGVDRGETVCDELYSGVTSDALVFYGDSSIGIKKDCYAENVVGLCKSPESAHHAFLANGQERFYGDNIEGISGYHAVVFKVEKSNINNVVARKSSVSGIYIKSDVLPTGSSCNQSNFSNLTVIDPGHDMQYALFVHASTAPLYNVNINNVQIIGGQEALKIVGDVRTSWVNQLRRVNISNVQIIGPTVMGLDTYGAIDECSISDLTVYASGSGKAVNIQSDCYGLHLNNIIASMTDAFGYADAIKLAGRVYADGITCIQDGSYATTYKRGIKDQRESGYGRLINTHGNVTT